MKKIMFVFMLLTLGYSNNTIHGMKRPLEHDQNDLNLKYFLNKKTFLEKWLFIRDLITQEDITTLEHVLKNISPYEKNKLMNHLNVIGRNLFHIAKEQHYFPIALLLCDHGADAHSIPPTIPPLIQATYYNDIEKVQELLVTLDKDKANKIKIHALFVASYEGHTHAVQILLDNAININTPNSYGDSALMMACANGHTATAQLLINRGAHINATNKDRKTALMLAATNGQADITRLLLDNNANTCLFGIDKKNALRLAQEQERSAVVELIIEEYEVPLAILLLAKEKKQNMIKPIVIDLTKQTPSKKQASKQSLKQTKQNNTATALIKPKKRHICSFSECNKSYTSSSSLKRHFDNKHV